MANPVHDPEVCPSELVSWHLDACNEAGWHCADCGLKMPGEPPGYRPDLDRSAIGAKVDSVVNWLHESELIYVSNSSEGESLTGKVAEECKRTSTYDQMSIIIMIAMNKENADYWKKLGEDVLAGKDPRRRCHCGKLANTFVGEEAFCSWACQDNNSKQGRLPW